MIWEKIDPIDPCPSQPGVLKYRIFILRITDMCFFFFYLVFLSQPFTNHRTADEGGGHLFNSSLLLPHASQSLRH